MRISQLSLTGQGAWPDLHVDRIDTQLNVFYSPPRSGKSTVAQLVGHLLYGKTRLRLRSENPWQIPHDSSMRGDLLSNHAAGSLNVDSPLGSFVMRRIYDGDPHGRLTLSATDGMSVDQHTLQSLLANQSSQFLSGLYAVDFAELPCVEWLLNGPLTRHLSNNERFTSKAGHLSSVPQSGDTRWGESCESASPLRQGRQRQSRQHVDELIQRRDAVSREIEQQLSVRRQQSKIQQSELLVVETELEDKRDRKEKLHEQLRGIDSRVAELEVRLRYSSLESMARHGIPNEQTESRQDNLDELDAEITRCRKTIGDLKTRANTVHQELAQLHPDGTADSVTCIADSRETLSVLERLLDDLDAEISQLARANQPGRCVGHEAHTRLSPVAEILRQQLYTLCGQLTEHQRSTQRQQLSAEARQLSRAQTDIGEQLEQFLMRRQALVRASQSARQQVMHLPQKPVATHCRCEHHHEFVETSDAMLLGRVDHQRHESDAQIEYRQLQGEQISLRNELLQIEDETERLKSRWRHLQHDRAGLAGATSLDTLHSELEQIEKDISRAIERSQESNAASTTTVAGSDPWRASDILAQLTDGELVQIRLQQNCLGQHGTEDGTVQALEIVDRSGRRHSLNSLSESQHDELYLSLTLAVVAFQAQSGIELPLILDEPFLRQDAGETAAMAEVLQQFAREGHQIILFTEDRSALRRFDSLGIEVRNLEQLRRRERSRYTDRSYYRDRATKPAFHTIPAGRVQTINETAAAQATEPFNERTMKFSRDFKTSQMYQRHPAENQDATIRIAADPTNTFYLQPSSSLDEFPVLGRGTKAQFEPLGILSVDDLLSANSHEIAQRLDRPDITEDTVVMWQSHMALMCFVPELTLPDAQVLTAVGIHFPGDLAKADADEFCAAIDRLMSSEAGQPFTRCRDRYQRGRLSSWRRGAERHRQRWEQSRQRYSWTSKRRNGSSNRHDRRSSDSAQRPIRPMRGRQENHFYLEQHSAVEDAPSIGPKTAARLTKVGIRSVADLLNADPESTAEELNVSHIKAETLATWQHQARLVCRIPELHGYGAQLLVACDFIEPEQIADADLNELVEKVQSFSRTKKGQRILHNGGVPDEEKIAAWSESAQHMRPLEAA